MNGIDKSLVMAAYNLGATPFRAFLKVFFPLSLAGVGAGLLITFILAVGFFITPSLLGGRGDLVISMLIENQIHVQYNWAFASSLAFVLLIFTLIIFNISSRFLGIDRIWGGEVVNGSAGECVKTHDTPKIKSTEIFFYMFCGFIFLFLILPIFIVFPISVSSSKYLEFPPRGLSLQWYRNFFGAKEWVSSTLTSIKVATMTSLLASLLGIPTALALTRGKFKGTQLIYSFLLSPMILPVIVIALAVYLHFARLHLVGNVYALMLAHTVLAVPMVLITVSSSLQGFDQNLEHAAMNLGANRIKTFFKITFPLIRPGVISGALFAFITSFDEIVIAIFLSGSQAITLPRRMWDSIHEEIDPTIAAVSSLLIFTSIFLLLSVGILRRRGERIRGELKSRS